MDATVWPWSAVVRVQVPGISRCTGFLLDPVTVVTAAHCLYAPRVGHMLGAGSVHILAGYARGTFAAHAVGVRVRFAAGFDPVMPDRGRGADVAVLTLAAPVGIRGLALVPAAPGTSAMLGGYERDRAEVILADPECRVMGTLADAGGRTLRQHSCAATFGTSGGPLLVRAAGGDWAAAGVAVGAVAGQAGGVAVPAASVVALLASK